MNNDKEKFKNEFKKRIYRLILDIIASVDSLPKNDPVCRVVSEQLVDSGTGMLSNYLEAQVASSKKDFSNYFRYCLKCCNETKMWVALLRDTNKVNKETANRILAELNEVGNIFASSLITLKNKT